MSEPVVCLSTASSEEEAVKIANALVSEHLAACVNIVPRIRSIYRWEGKVEDGEEWLMVIKTAKHCVADLAWTLRSLHSYKVPELVAMPVIAGNPEYLEWLADSTWSRKR